jgi:hypothetical protein
MSLGLEAAASVIGAYRWTELQLFSLTGGWVPGTADPEVRLHLDLVSGEHGWHAELWGERLPVLDRLDPEALTRPLGDALGPLFSTVKDALGEGQPDGGLLTLLRLAALYRVLLPRLLSTYERHLRHSVPVTDGPTIRVLRLVLRDEVESWQLGEMLLERTVRSPEDVRAVAALQVRLETTIVESRLGPGLVPWPM